MKIHVELDGIRMIATLDDNATSRDFVSLLPLTLTLDDYNGTEKISDLPKKLSTRGVPEGITPRRGRHRVLRTLGQFGHLLQGLFVFAWPREARRLRGRRGGTRALREFARFDPTD